MVSTSVPAGETIGLIKPDEKFIREVMKRGGESVKKCFQCGTCSVTCELTYAREGASFPRQQILWTQWGLKDKVLRDPAIWQCYQCNDCSANCPRGAKPGDVLAAVRSVAIERFSPPSFISRLFWDPRGLPLVFGIPAAILVVLVAALQGFNFPKGEIEYDRFISSRAIEIAASLVVAYAVVVAGLGLLRFWRELRTMSGMRLMAGPMVPVAEPAVAEPAEVSDGPGAMAASAGGAGLGASLASTGTDIVMHTSFRQCKTDWLRLWGHLGVFYGTPFLLLAAGIAAIYTFIGADVQRPPSDVAKIFGNLGGLLVFAGLCVLVYNRFRAKKGTWGRGSYADWFFIVLVFLLVVTGALMEVARYAGSGSAAYSLYMVHLVFVFAAFVYAPYGKFAHAFYRAAALAYTKLRVAGGAT
jgi:quinone-modifying oxidoreductase subunit QmoC